jgi:murein DD-endopeptidase MepM/ murein hydrolase activator NlpD
MRFARPLNAILAVAIVLPLLVGAAPKHPHKKTSLKDLKKSRKQLHNKKSDVLAQIRKNRHRAGVTRRSISQIDGRISDLASAVAETQNRLVANKKRQIVVAKQLEDATTQLAIRSEQARMRLREIYMHGQASLASAIVGSQSLADLASRRFIFERITQRDRELFDDVRELRRGVAEKKKDVDSLVIQITKDIDDEKTEKAELQDTRQEKTEALQDLKDKESNLEALLHQLDVEDASMEAQIAQYDAGPGRMTSAFHGRFMVPVFGARMASPFGMRYHPILHRVRMHTGQDFAIKSGTPIHAAAPGIVITCTYMHGYGNCVVVDHGGGISTLYGHCSRFGSSPGQHVEKGQVIAYVGSTGLATGPHCHFEVRVKGHPVNPMPYLR